jgi:hypothetical protein
VPTSLSFEVGLKAVLPPRTLPTLGIPYRICPDRDRHIRARSSSKKTVTNRKKEA